MISPTKYLLGDDAQKACRANYQKARSFMQPAGQPELQFQTDTIQSTPIEPLGLLQSPKGATTVFAAAFDSQNPVPLVIEQNNETFLTFDLVTTIESLLEESYVSWRKPMSSYLPFNYRIVPGSVRQEIHKGIVKHRRKKNAAAMEGAWPFNCAMELLLFIAGKITDVRPGKDPLDLGNLWMTHDVDDVDGLHFALLLSGMQRNYGFKATYFLPATLLRSNLQEVEKIKSRGHSIGLHGLTHDNRQLEMDPDMYLEKILAHDDLLQDLDVQAYRGPSLLTNPKLRQALSKRFLIDSSIPDTDVYSEAADRRGCAYWRPYPSQGLWEVPITLPMDDRLLTLIGAFPERLLEIWEDKAKWVQANDGLTVWATHTQPGIYQDLDFEKMMRRSLKMFLRLFPQEI